MFARHPMVPLLAIWLRLLTWLPPKKMGSAPGNMVASINLATAKKMVARPPMVAQPPMVPLLAIWLRLLTWLPPKKMVAWPPMVARPPTVVLKMDKIQTINWSHVGIIRWHHHQTPSNLIFLATAKKNGCTTSYGCATSYGSAPGNMVASVNLATAKKNGCVTSYGCAKHGQNTGYKLITRGN